MAPKAKKTTTTKTTTKRPREDDDPPDEPMPEVNEPPEKKPYRVNSKAGLVTYSLGDTKVECLSDLKEMMEELKKKFKHDLKLSMCLEVCPESGKFHCHVFYECTERLDCLLTYFETSKSGKPNDFKPNNGSNIQRGHFYVQCEWKKGQVCNEYDEYVLPLEKWVMDLWKQKKIQKITEALTAYKLLKPQLVQQINCQENKEEKIITDKMLREREERIQGDMRGFAPNQVVDEWRETFKKETMRYKFLVLHGPSRMRKTEFAKSLFPNYHHHKDKIDWDGYSWLKNGSVIFDDIQGQPEHIWKLVQHNKILFQSSSTVAVNTSATNCYKRDICVVQKPIIICTNDNLLEKFISAPFREWIYANCVWVDVTEPIPFLENQCPPLQDITDYKMHWKCDHGVLFSDECAECGMCAPESPARPAISSPATCLVR